MSKNEISDGWKWKRLNDLVENPNDDIVSGPFGSNLVVSDYQEEGVPIIRLQNIQRRKFLKIDMKYISSTKATELKRHSYLPGDILLAKLGIPIGKSCVIPKDFEEGVIVADVVRVRINKKENNVQFIEYVLNSSTVTNQLNNKIIGSTRPRVNLNDVRDLWIPTPNLTEQEKIVSKLDKQMVQIETMKKEADRKISSSSFLYKSYLRKLMQKSNNVRRYTFSDLFEVTMGQSPDGTSYNKEMQGSPLLNGPTEFGNIYPTPVQWTTQPTKVCRKGDILLCVRGNTTGRTNTADQEYCIGRGLAAIRPKNKKVNFSVILHVLAYAIEEILTKSSGSTFPNLTGKELTDFELSLPEKVEDMNYLSNLLDEIKINCNEITQNVKIQKQSIDQLSQSILYEVFGKYKIPDEA